MTIGEVIAILTAVSALIGVMVGARTSVRKSDLARKDEEIAALTKRLVDAENRLAQAERRAVDSEKQANDFRLDVIRLGERINKERHENQSTVMKLVVIIEQLFKQVEAATGQKPADVDLDALHRLIVVES